MTLSIKARCTEILPLRDNEAGREKATTILLGILPDIQTKGEFLTVLGHRNCLGKEKIPELDHALLDWAKKFKLTRADLWEIRRRVPEGSATAIFVRSYLYG